MEAAKSIRLLEATREDVLGAFGDTSPFYGHEGFSREETRILVSYATGKCTYRDSSGVDADDWAVEPGRVSMIRIFPKSAVTLTQIAPFFPNLRKEQLYKGRKDWHVFHNKSAGVTVTTRSDLVDSILLFPSSKNNSLLCQDDKTLRYYANKNWRRVSMPDVICVLVSLPTDVTNIDLKETTNRQLKVRVAAQDPENDVLTYVYKVSAGKIIGKGANVIWDLSEDPAGSHSIIAGADDGCGVCGKYVTRTVTID